MTPAKKSGIEVYSVGAINLDIIVDGFLPEMAHTKSSEVKSIGFHTGGDTQNCSLTQARLGIKVAIGAAAGDDPARDICKGELEKAGVDCRWLREKEGASGMCVDLITAGGEAMFMYNPGVNAGFSNADIGWEAMEEARLVSLHSLFYCGMIEPAELFRRAREHGCLTLADTLPTKDTDTLDLIASALPYLDYIVPSLGELQHMTGDADPGKGAKRLLEMGAKNVVVKMGDDGCLFVDGKERVHVPGFRVEVVDTTGAGDNFIAGLIYGLMRDLSMPDAMTFANACGAITVGAVGSNGAVRSAEQVREFIARFNRR